MVRKGDPLFTLNANDAARFERALEAVEGAYVIGDASTFVPRTSLIAERITAE
jgi:thymidine phosphorylase